MVGSTRRAKGKRSRRQTSVTEATTTAATGSQEEEKKKKKKKQKTAPTSRADPVDLTPAFIRLRSNEEVSEESWLEIQETCEWSSPSAAEYAANHRRCWCDEMDVCRYAGTVTLFSGVPENVLSSEKRRRTLFERISTLSKHNEDENFTNRGEPTAAEQASSAAKVKPIFVSRVFDALKDHLSVESCVLAKCMIELQRSDGLWKLPLVRCVCYSSFEEMNSAMDQNQGLTLVFKVYFTRLLFEIISDPNLKFLMLFLRPCMPVAPAKRPIHLAVWGDAKEAGQPLRIAELEGSFQERNQWIAALERHTKLSGGAGEIPTYTKAERTRLLKEAKADRLAIVQELCQAKFDLSYHRWGQQQQTMATSKRESCFTPVENVTNFDDDFTLAGVLRNCISTGYPRECEQPEELSLEMLQYQRQTVQWMQDMEKMEGGLNGLFWETRRWAGSSSSADADADADADAGEEYYYFPLGGELRLQKPPSISGGILCEEMGMGKTLEVLALVLLDGKGRKKKAVLDKSSKVKDGFVVKSSATLIIVPSTLLSQWILEVTKCTRANAVKVGTYERKKMVGKLERKLLELASCDIVFCHYGDLERSSPLRKIHWRRVVIDECQMIRSSTTMIAKNCRALVSDHRWMVSGTPLYSSIDDLNGILAFLKIWPFSLSDREDGFWGLRIGQPWQTENSQFARTLVLELMSKICMRHSKAQCHVGTGDPILSLPKRRVRSLAAHLEGCQRYVQHFTEFRCRKELERQMMRGPIKDASNIVSLPMLCCTSASIDAGPNNTLFHELDKILRKLILSGSSVSMSQDAIFGIRSLPPQEAMEVLMRPLANEGSSRDKEIGFVRHDNKERGLYNTARSYAVGMTVQQKYEEASEKMQKMQEDLLYYKQSVAWLRWRYAVERITRGSVLLSFERSSLRMMKMVFSALRGTPESSKAKPVGWKRKVELDSYVVKASETEAQLVSLRPIVTILASAIKVGGGTSTLMAKKVDQSGFASLIEIEEGRRPTCAICLQDVKEPVVTRCVHIACSSCMMAWFEASSVLYKNKNKKTNCAPCPLCRQEFTLSTLIRVKSAEEDKVATEETSHEPLESSSKPVERESPEICPPIESADLNAIASYPADNPDIPHPKRDPRFPALSRFFGFLQHAAFARHGSFTGPKESIIRDMLAEHSKLVIFSQFPASLKFLIKRMKEWGVEHRYIMSGMAKSDRADAIGEFNVNPSCQCFLLHASAAAAGLTLTVAQTCVMLEPFLSLGDEQQAINRLYRIGQRKDVSVVTLYCQGTIEERILAWRQENDVRNDQGREDLAVLPSGSEAAKISSLAKLKSFFGLKM